MNHQHDQDFIQTQGNIQSFDQEQEQDIRYTQKQRNLTIVEDFRTTSNMHTSSFQIFINQSHGNNYPLYSQILMTSEFIADFHQLDPHLIKSIQETGFLDTCEIHLKEVQGFFTKYDVEEIIRYSETPINQTSLTFLPKNLQGNLKFAQSFLYLPEDQQASIEDSGTKHIFNLLCYIHSIGLQSFVDEIYIQTIKQMSMCSDLFLQTYYSNILIMLCSSYMPSRTWYMGILNCLFLASKTLEDYIDYQPNIRNKLDLYIISQKVAENCRMAFFRMIKTFSAPQRKYPPTLQEIKLTLEFRKIPVPISIYHDNTQYIQVESYYQASHVIDVIQKEFNISPLSDKLGLSLSDVDDNLIIDYLTIIEQIQTKRINLRMKDFFIFDQSDLSSVDLYYIHFANEYLKNSYSLEVEQIYKLAAYKLYIDYGGMIQNASLNYDIEKFVPQGFYDLDTEKINEIYRNIDQDSKQCKIDFLEELRNQPLFLAWQFKCVYKENDSLFCLKPYSVIIACENKEIKKSYALLQFGQIVSWNIGKNTLQMKSEDGKSHIFKFDDQIECYSIYILFEEYMNQALLWKKGM